MNNIRGVVDTDRELILLYCRYSPYIVIGEDVIEQLAYEQGYSTKSLE
ncbi:hypothetical protein VCR4J2_250736 [Vibrio coralliirubri]|nr:hypothetical protein [Vibrio coralliirubri]CDT15213.1 hypothetical protein VCR4J2_250736 [Vibrio coralliirubri]